MDENHEGQDPENEVPQKHPIVERPEFLWDPDLSLIFESEREQIIRYIEQTETDRDYWKGRAEANSMR